MFSLSSIWSPGGAIHTRVVTSGIKKSSMEQYMLYSPVMATPGP